MFLIFGKSEAHVLKNVALKKACVAGTQLSDDTHIYRGNPTMLEHFFSKWHNSKSIASKTARFEFSDSSCHWATFIFILYLQIYSNFLAISILIFEKFVPTCRLVLQSWNIMLLSWIHVINLKLWGFLTFLYHAYWYKWCIDEQSFRIFKPHWCRVNTF